MKKIISSANADKINKNMKEYERGKYNQIINIPQDIKVMAMNLLKEVQNATNIDEHGGWEFGILNERYVNGRVHSLNYDFFGFGYDIHNNNFLAVIQVREFYRKKASYYPQIRKNYFLLGHNEDATCFAHSIESRVIHHAVRKNRDVVKAVQDWMFGADYSKLERQGDICIQKVRKVKGNTINENQILIENSHQLNADIIYSEDSTYYCKNPKLTHLKNVHPNIEGKGNYKIILAKRADCWKFALPTND